MSTLGQLFDEPLDAVRERERTAFDRLLDDCDRRLVLFGAGGLGRNAVLTLRSIGVEPLGMTDNNTSLWGGSIDGVPVLAPEQAADRFGATALFLVTIWNPFHWYQETRARLTSLGCRRIAPPSALYWRFPDTFLPFYAQDFPHRVYERAPEVMAAAELWSDAPSREEYDRQVRWRALGDWHFERPSAEDTESYFLPRIFSLRDDEVFVDCGAFDGDTLRAYLAHHPGGFRRYIAVEPGQAAFDKLQAFVASLPDSLRERVQPLRSVAGLRRERLRFDDTGDMGSKASGSGTSTIESIPIADMTAPGTPITFIKMDIEGAEEDALAGGRPAIERDAPILAVCVYHAQDHLWRLPLLMRQMVPHYRFFLRCHEGDGWQTVAYAVPPQRCSA